MKCWIQRRAVLVTKKSSQFHTLSCASAFAVLSDTASLSLNRCISAYKCNTAFSNIALSMKINPKKLFSDQKWCRWGPPFSHMWHTSIKE